MALPLLSTNKQFRRQYSADMDETKDHETYVEMVEYVTSDPMAYAGQFLYCKENDEIYRIGIDTEGAFIIKPVCNNDVGSEEYFYEGYPSVSTVKTALDYLFANSLNNSGNNNVSIDNYCYYGTSVSEDIGKEEILSNFSKIEILPPDPNNEDDLKKNFYHCEIDFGNNFDVDKYCYFISPYKYKEPEMIDSIRENLGEGGFEWGLDNLFDFKYIELPNTSGLIQEYIFKRSDYSNNDGGSWIFYFPKANIQQL